MYKLIKASLEPNVGRYEPKPVPLLEVQNHDSLDECDRNGLMQLAPPSRITKEYRWKVGTP